MATREVRHPKDKEIAVIGLGQMGAGIAWNLRRKGFRILGCDIREEARRPFAAQGIPVTSDVHEAAAKCDTVATCVEGTAAMALAREPMLSLNVPFESGDSTVTQLVNLCGCFPNLIQLMCHDLIKEVKKTGAARISPAMVNAAFSSYAFATSVYEPFLENFNAYQKLIVYAALMVKSMSLESITERVQEYYRLSMSRIEQLLDELVLLFILDKQGASYRWVYEGFPTILRRQVRDVDFRIKQTIKEIENETQNR